jgi:hypothetical protein
MHFIEPINRAQVTFGSLEDLMSLDNPVRLIDAFADPLVLKRLGFGVKESKMEGRPAFEQRVTVSRRLKRTSPFISFSRAPWHPSQFSFRRLLISAAASSHLRLDGNANTIIRTNHHPPAMPLLEDLLAQIEPSGLSNQC